MLSLKLHKFLIGLVDLRIL